jgi:hypothetical protein
MTGGGPDEAAAFEQDIGRIAAVGDHADARVVDELALYEAAIAADAAFASMSTPARVRRKRRRGRCG